MSKGVSIWNPDLPEGPDNKRPNGSSGKELTPAQQWTSQHKKTGRAEYKQPGRAPIEIDWGVFAELCAIFCTKAEIAGVFHCSEDTIERACKREFGDKYTFKVVWNQLAAPGKVSLRRAQFKAAVGGNVLAQIWLGKQVLGQRDTPAPAQDDDEESQKGLAQEVYGTTFVGKAGEENTLVNAPPDAVRPSNASNPGPDSSAAAQGPAPQ